MRTQCAMAREVCGEGRGVAANRLCGRICHSMPHSVAAEIVRQRGVSVWKEADAQQPCMMSSSSANTAGCVNGGSGSVSALA